jgi:dipeptidyl aminopeptidase/acylaminoacyl peptidase
MLHIRHRPRNPIPLLGALLASACATAPGRSPGAPTSRPAGTAAAGDSAGTAVAAAGSPGAPAAPAAPAPAYQGHGADSISAARLAQYAPRPLAPEVNQQLQKYLDIHSPGAGILTPGARQLVFTWQVTGVAQVWRLDGPQRFPVQLTGGDDSTEVVAVLPDGQHLVLQRDRRGEENPGIYLQKLAGGALTPVQHTQGVQTLFNGYSRDGRYLYFRANDRVPDAYALYRYDLRERRKELLWDQPGLWEISDVGDDERLLVTLHTGALTGEIFELALRETDPARRMRPLFGQGEREEYAVAYGARKGEILVLTNKFGEYHRLYSHRDGKLSPISEEVAHDVSHFALDRARTRILYALNEGGYTRPRALDARTLKPVRLPSFGTEVDHVRWGRTTDDGRYTPLTLEYPGGPPRSFVLDWKSGRMTPWHASSAPEIDTTSFAVATLEDYPARDGTRIPALVNRPARCAQKPCPVIVHFHGGPEGQSVAGFSLAVAAFTDAGFIFVRPNVRGSDGYGKSWLRADDGPRRLQVITDIEDAARWARERFTHQGAAPKVGIYGGSYGGYSAFMGMTRFAGAYDAGVAVVGISDLRTFLRNTAPYRRILRISEYGDPETDQKALTELSPITYVDRVKAPILILHGATDPRVPAGEAIQIHEILQGKGIASELAIFADEGHGMKKRSNRVLAMGHALAFFRKHLASE